jgi:hypothetical protein
MLKSGHVTRPHHPIPKTVNYIAKQDHPDKPLIDRDRAFKESKG